MVWHQVPACARRDRILSAYPWVPYGEIICASGAIAQNSPNLSRSRTAHKRKRGAAMWWASATAFQSAEPRNRFGCRTVPCGGKRSLKTFAAPCHCAWERRRTVITPRGMSRRDDRYPIAHHDGNTLLMAIRSRSCHGGSRGLLPYGDNAQRGRSRTLAGILSVQPSCALGMQSPTPHRDAALPRMRACGRRRPRALFRAFGRVCAFVTMRGLECHR